MICLCYRSSGAKRIKSRNGRNVVHKHGSQVDHDQVGPHQEGEEEVSK